MVKHKNPLYHIEIPSPSLPRYIEGYKMPTLKEKLLDWRFVEEILLNSNFYWLTTINEHGTPHSRPLCGIYYEKRLFFDGKPETRWIQNLLKNPKVNVHVPSPEEVCIVEGTAHMLGDNDIEKETWDILDDTYKRKYNEFFASPYIYVEPIKILAWDTSTFERMTVFNIA